MSRYSSYQGSGSQVVQFLRGLSLGLTGEDLGLDIGQCFTEGTGVEKQIGDAISLFEQGGIIGVAEGIYKIKEIIKEIPDVFGDCKEIGKSALEKLKNFTARFTDLKTIMNKVAKNLIFHGSKIYGYTKDSVSSFKTGDMYNGGLNAGLAINLATA